MDADLADRITKTCYEHYNKLPKTGKPNSTKEWTHLAAIVKLENTTETNPLIEIVSISTGSKCIGQSKMSPDGDIVNDSHAEVLSRRGFLRYLYYHVSKTLKSEYSEVLEYNPIEKLCFVKKGISFHLFISHTPCGDASIFLKDKMNKDNKNLKRKIEDDTDEKISKKLQNITKSQKYLIEDTVIVQSDVVIDDIYRTGAKCVSKTKQDPLLPGINYHVTEVLRTKPGRGDQTLSLSCSDKIAKWNVVGLQGALLSHFLEPIYLTSVVIGNCPYNEQAMKRAVYERIVLQKDLPNAYKHNCPQLLLSSMPFQHGPELICLQNSNATPAPAAIVWSNIPINKLEVIINGKKQGVTLKTMKSIRSKLNIAKSSLFNSFRNLLEIENDKWTPKLKNSVLKTYNDFKLAATDYQRAKQCLCETLGKWPTKSPELEMFTWDM